MSNFLGMFGYFQSLKLHIALAVFKRTKDNRHKIKLITFTGRSIPGTKTASLMKTEIQQPIPHLDFYTKIVCVQSNLYKITFVRYGRTKTLKA